MQTFLMRPLAMLLLAALSPIILFAAPATAQSAPSASVCTHPAQTVLTRTFSPISPHNSPRTLTNPLNPNDTSPLTMLTIGDSAIWGNGLDNDHKYAHQAAQHVADATGRVVNLFAYAHSGANLSTEAGQIYEPMRPSDNGTPPGDLNAGLPTTLQQEACAKKDYSQAEVILLNGCINDVSAEAIGLPFPFSGATADEIKRRALKQCADPMLTLLKNTQHDFPKATIIVANYWLIISDKSSPAGVTIAKGFARATSPDPTLNKEFENLLSAQRKAAQETGQNFVESDLHSDPTVIFRKWSDNSRAFLDTSQDCFVWAISKANGKSPAPDPCPHMTPAAPLPATQNLRVFLAAVPDKPEFAYGAGKDKHLWSVPIGLKRHDQEYARRLALCKTHYSIGGDRFICTVNPTAHPNVLGAKAFTDRIDKILDIAWKRP